MLGSPAAAFAVDPPPDGGYPNGNSTEGTSALLYLGTGANNTARGYTALQNNSIGNYNTATGANALSLNFSGSSNTANGFNSAGNLPAWCHCEAGNKFAPGGDLLDAVLILESALLMAIGQAPTRFDAEKWAAIRP